MFEEQQEKLIKDLIELREKKGLSQRDLAALSGIKQPAIARLESGRSVPSVYTLCKLLSPLGYKLAILPADD